MEPAPIAAGSRVPKSVEWSMKFMGLVPCQCLLSVRELAHLASNPGPQLRFKPLEAECHRKLTILSEMHQGRKGSDAGMPVWQRDSSRCPIAALPPRTGMLRFAGVEIQGRNCDREPPILTRIAALVVNCGARDIFRKL